MNKMKEKIFKITIFAIICLSFFTACSRTSKSSELKVESTVQLGQDEESETGAFNDMQIIKNGYRLTVHTQTPGHPTPEADFQTSFDWQDSNQTETIVIERFLFVESSILKDYGSRDCAYMITIDDKDMLYVWEGEKQIDLLYEISDELYLKIELLVTDCFDCKSGEGIPFDGQMEEILENQKFLQSINFTVEEE